MKRMLIALSLLLLLTALCTAAILYQKTQTEALLTLLGETEEAFDSDRPEELLPRVEALIDEFHVRTRWFPLFLRHTLISEAEAELLTLPSLLRNGEPRDVPAALIRCRARLEALYESELPRLENIL